MFWPLSWGEAISPAGEVNGTLGPLISPGLGFKYNLTCPGLGLSVPYIPPEQKAQAP